MKALVTGATGFVGSHIVRALVAAGHSARVLHRSTSKLDALADVTTESALGDILNPDSLRAACSGCDWVFHVAAVADYWRADHTRMFTANVDGTRHVLEAARETGVKRVVFTSSAAAIGFREDGLPADEAFHFNLPPAQFPYGYSKVLAEEVVQEAVAAGQDVVITNPVIVMGPGDLNMISGSYIVQVKRFGRFVPVTSGGIAVVDVRDVAALHLAAVERGRTGERYILGTANYTHREWYGMIADAVGTRPPFLSLPDFVLPIAAAGIHMARKVGIETPVDADQTRLGGRNIYFAYEKALSELGKPQVDMHQSLQDTYAWYQAHGYL